MCTQVPCTYPIPTQTLDTNTYENIIFPHLRLRAVTRNFCQHQLTTEVYVFRLLLQYIINSSGIQSRNARFPSCIRTELYREGSLTEAGLGHRCNMFGPLLGNDPPSPTSPVRHVKHFYGISLFLKNFYGMLSQIGMPDDEESRLKYLSFP